MLPNVTVNKLSSTSGRPAPGFDYYSGLVVYGTAPTGYAASYAPTGLPAGNIKQLFSITDASNAGILPNTDNTAATGSIAWGTGSSLGTLATGDTITVAVPFTVPVSATYPLGIQTVVIATYVVIAADITDTTGAALAGHVSAAINAQTYNTGFSAATATNVSTITAPKSAGKGLNTISATMAISNSHTMTNTIVAFASGTASQYAIWYYHIKRFFYQNPTGTLFVGIFASSTSFNEILTLQSFAGGLCRQIGVYDNSASTGLAANIIGTVASLQVIKNALDVSQPGMKAPISIIYAPNITAVTDLSTYPNQGANTAPGVSCVIAQDGAAAGAQLYINSAQSVGAVGETLGAVSASPVNESIAYVGGYNATDGVENNVPAFANGKLNITVDPTGNGLIAQLDNFRYIFYRTFPGTIAGTYWNNNHCCVTPASQYAYMNDNRTMDKVARLIYGAEVPLLSKTIILNKDGTLKNYSIRIFQNAGEDAVTAAMITGKGTEPEIGGIALNIDPTQNIQATNNLIITGTVVEDAVARNITVNIGYGTI